MGPDWVAGPGPGRWTGGGMLWLVVWPRSWSKVRSTWAMLVADLLTAGKVTAPGPMRLAPLGRGASDLVAEFGRELDWELVLPNAAFWGMKFCAPK